MKLIDDWRKQVFRLWSLRVAFFWTVIGGGVALLPLVSDEAKAFLGPWAFAGLFMAMFVSFTLARLLKQPGTDGTP